MMKRVAKQVAGWLFIVLGIVGLFLPILQGVLFILIGMIILARDVPFFHKVLTRLEERYPELFAKSQRLHADISDWFREIITRFTKCGKPQAPDSNPGTDE